ncbi:hypothetical protein LSAT2_009780 [Lamellibrachia satsuma]|nr:hypothetical protein LSAT2_009780 [Lamellibrachia satsuma]
MRPILYSIRSDVESKDSNMNPPKRYGLLQLKSSGVNKGLVKKPSIFGNDSDEEPSKKEPQKPKPKEQLMPKSNNKTAMNMRLHLQISRIRMPIMWKEISGTYWSTIP